MLSKEFGTHLTGRNIQTELFPFSFKEFLRWKEIEVKENDFHSPIVVAKIKNTFFEYLKVGGLPEFIQTSNYIFLKNLYNDILYRDVIARYNIRNEKTLIELLHFLVIRRYYKTLLFDPELLLVEQIQKQLHTTLHLKYSK